MQLNKEILTVSELNFAIKKNLEKAFAFVCVKGEISNLKVQSSGHLYFDLKDIESKISCALFRLDAAKIKPLPKDGDLVLVKGEINVWGQKGSYQLIVRALQQEGLGELLLKFQELKTKLQTLGWFDSRRKKKIPPFPKTIGVVTSPTGAVIQDILHVLTRRHPGFHLILNPVLVQGEGAAAQIAKAIADFNTYQLADVLIVGRGGGSLEDLWAFNEESVAQAIFESRIPIISAVGHETDFSIADFVADVRAPTPSAAAEIAAADKQLAKEQLFSLKKRAFNTFYHLVRERREKLQSLQKRPEMAISSFLFKNRYLKLDLIEEQIHQCMLYTLKESKTHFVNALERLKMLSLQKLMHQRTQLLSLKEKTALLNPKTRICSLYEKLEGLKKGLFFALCQRVSAQRTSFLQMKASEKLSGGFHKLLQDKKEKLSALVSHLNSIDPKNLLQKGYSIVFDQNRTSVILSKEQIHIHDKLSILMHDGIVLVETKEIHERK